MNNEPQDLTSSSRPAVEGLRSGYDQRSIQTTAYDSGISRDQRPRQEHNEDNVARDSTASGSLEHTQSEERSALSPSLYEARDVSISSTAIPQRSHSLGYDRQEAYSDARMILLADMMRQRRDHELRMDAARRRATSAISIAQNPASTPRRHTSSTSTSMTYPRRESNSGSHDSHTSRPYLRPSLSRNEHTSNGEYALPRWQPDAEVDKCPICKHSFSFFYRKHHCRKCGRVVCANCSPHKITIPQQYIVNPPPVMPIEIDLTGDSSQEDESTARVAANQVHPSLDGGQEVRLCNPCVPDPNPLPPPPYHGSISRSIPISAGRHLERRLSSNRLSQPQTPFSAEYSRYGVSEVDSRTVRRNLHHTQSSPLNMGSTTPYGSAPDIISAHLPRYIPSRSHRSHASMSVMPSSRHRAMFDALTSTEAPPEPPRRQIAEEDECPICHEELPPKGSDGSEADREAHVTACIEEHFSTSRPKASSIPHPASAVAAAVVASSATPAEAGSSVPVIAGPSTRRRTTGMVVYLATEKDCVGDDDILQECIICFEDFEPGVEMGRLECLCKFHKSCIRSWWDTKGAGACPVHQGGLI